jgi:hypothetical protein
LPHEGKQPFWPRIQAAGAYDARVNSPASFHPAPGRERDGLLLTELGDRLGVVGQDAVVLGERELARKLTPERLRI